MYILYADETNYDSTGNDFFIYGGVSIESDKAASLSSCIDSLRDKYGYKPLDPLKFNTRERPTYITPDRHREIKKEIIESAVAHDVKLFVSFIYHDIAKSPDAARRNEINRICYHFNCYMNWRNDHGLVLLDNFQDDQLSEILKEKFSVGLIGLPYSQHYRLERILGFHLASIGSSHFCSVIDVVIGAIRFVVNSRNDRHKEKVCLTILKQIQPLFIKDSSGAIDEISLFYSPKVVKADKFYQKYVELNKFLEKAGINSRQKPSQTRNY